MLNRILLPLVLALLVGGFTAGVVVGDRIRATDDARANAPATAEAPASAPAAQTRPASLTAASVGPDFTRVAAQSVKGVANISSLQVVRRSNSPFGNDPFFRYFFGDDDAFYGPRDRRSLSLGSGVIISADGYIVTSNHVIGENMREITIALPDKREV